MRPSDFRLIPISAGGNPMQAIETLSRVFRRAKAVQINRENIVRIKAKDPQLTAPEIAERLGLTARQVRYVLQQIARDGGGR